MFHGSYLQKHSLEIIYDKIKIRMLLMTAIKKLIKPWLCSIWFWSWRGEMFLYLSKLWATEISNPWNRLYLRNETRSNRKDEESITICNTNLGLLKRSHRSKRMRQYYGIFGGLILVSLEKPCVDVSVLLLSEAWQLVSSL